MSQIGAHGAALMCRDGRSQRASRVSGQRLVTLRTDKCLSFKSLRALRERKSRAVLRTYVTHLTDGRLSGWVTNVCLGHPKWNCSREGNDGNE